MYFDLLFQRKVATDPVPEQNHLCLADLTPLGRTEGLGKSKEIEKQKGNGSGLCSLVSDRERITLPNNKIWGT